MRLDKHPKARGLIFDLDGTLADTMTIHLEAWKRVGRNHGFEYPEELFYELAGTPTRNIVPILNERLGLDLDVEATVREKEGAFLESVGDVKVIEPVADIVWKYHGVIPMTVGTGGTRDLAALTLKTIGMELCFVAMVTADDVMRHKPEPDTFLKCAELMEVAPRFCQVFEDGEQGLAAARRAGMIATDVRPFLA